MSPWAALVKVLTEPRITFEALREKPAILQPYLALVLVAMITALVTYARTAELVVAQLQASGQVTPEAINMMKTVQMFLAPVAAAVTTIVVSLISAAVLLFIGTLLDGKASFAQMFSMIGYASIPSGVIGGLIKLAMIATTPPASVLYVSTSAAAFLPRAAFGTVLYRVLTLLDPFAIWSLVLVIVGYAAVARFSVKKSAAVVIPLWLVASAIGFAIAGKAMNSMPNV